MSKAMNCNSSSTTILHSWLLLILLLFIYITSLSSSSTTTTATTTTTNKFFYSDHCNSIVPESIPTFEHVTTFSFPFDPKIYCTGGNPLFNQNSSTSSWKYLSFRRGKIYKTNVDGVLKVQARLILRNSLNMYYFDYNNYSSDGQSQSTRVVSRRSRFGVLNFQLKGYWSETTGKVCMVGFGTTYSKHGDLLHLGAVFRFNYVKNSSIITSLGTGSLESLNLVHDRNYFEPISILMFTEMNNDYGLVLKENENGGFNGSEVSQNLPLTSQPTRSLCPIFISFSQFVLTYPSTCESAKNCTHFGRSIGYLPHGMSLNLIECSEENQRVRVLMNFFDSSYGDGWYYMSFDPNTTLIGEGFWDGKKNKLLIVACKILNVTGSLENAHVGDCSIRLSLRFPATWTIRYSSNMLGQIWSSKPRNDSEYFDKIMFKSTQEQGVGNQGLKYKYTQIDRVRKLCTPAKKQNKKKKERYPDGDSYDMSFDMSVSSSRGNFTWGYASPLFVGDHFYERNGYAMAPTGSMPMASETGKKASLEVPVNISYKIGFSQIPSVEFGGGNSTYIISPNQMILVEISAEGVYDAETGGLCMVGCKKIGSQGQLMTKDAQDCEILLNFQFPSLNTRNKGRGYIEGTIESMRKKSDPLYFEHLDLNSSAYVSSMANDNNWRMDFEIILVLISNTLACVFVAFQLFYVNKHPETLPFTSLLMLAILTFSYMIPLLLYFEALFLENRDRQNVSLESGKRIEVNEVQVCVVTTVAFLLQFRLLQLTWSSRLGDAGSQKKDLWTSEKKAFLYILLPLYVAGALIAWLVNWRENNNNHVVALLSLSSESTSYQQLLEDLRSYAGLVLDGFLLPQIFLNMFGNTREKALSLSYYSGTTFVRLLPHTHDLYMAHSEGNAGRFEQSYIYANHGVYFYSAAWDVTIPCVVLVFAAIIFLQQRFGGRCIIPRRFREVEEYEKVPVISNGTW